jgi:hypothetical protein
MLSWQPGRSPFARASSSKGSAGAASGTPLCLAQAIPLLTVTHLQLVPAENR